MKRQKTEFKVGDRVRLKEDNSGFKKGFEFIIKRLSKSYVIDSDYLVMMDDNKGFFDFRLEKVEELPKPPVKKIEGWGF